MLSASFPKLVAILALSLNFIGTGMVFFGLEVHQPPKVIELAPGSTVRPNIEIQGIPFSDVALVRANRPSLASWGLALISGGFFLQLAAEVGRRS